MKRIVVILFGLCLAFAFLGCSDSSTGGKTPSGEGNNPPGENVFKLAANDVAGNNTQTGQPVDITLSATADEGKVLTYLINVPPANGTLVQKSGPVWTYTPYAHFSGPDSFKYHVNDGTDDSNIANVSISVVSTAKVTATGGSGDFNNGGHGGSLIVHSMRNLKVTKQGALDTSFSIPVLTQNLGSHPAIVATNTEVFVETSEPAFGVLYMVEGDENLYISDGNGVLGPYESNPQHDVATGLQVNAGVTLLLNSNHGVYDLGRDDTEEELAYYKPIPICCLYFGSDVVVNGTIMTKPVPGGGFYGSNCKGSLSLETGRYFIVAQTGVIDLSGDQGSPFPLYGGYGGMLKIHADYAVELRGLLNTSGGKGTTWGGDAGLIKITGDLAGIYVSDTGMLKALGGEGEGGGDGGEVLLRNDGCDIYSAGTISTMGGHSLRGDAGDGGKIKITVGDDAATGNLIVSGDLNSTGGTCDERGEGGDGGSIKLTALSGNMKLSGKIWANGGDALGYQNDGGDGGDIYLNATHHRDAEGRGTGLIQVTNDIAANGGMGEASGGCGGKIKIETTMAYIDVAPTHDVELIGYQTIDVSGGYGSQFGGHAGSLALYTSEKDRRIPEYYAGSILNETDVLAVGGNGPGNKGGSGGHVLMVTCGDEADGAATITNSGNIDITDGDGAYGVVDEEYYPQAMTLERDRIQLPAGYLFEGRHFVMILGLDDVENSGTIDANGGNAALDLWGADGGDIIIVSGLGNASNLNTVSAFGGNGPDYGGDGGSFQLLAEMKATNSGSLNFYGGTDWGDGGMVRVDSGERPSVNNALLITVAGSTHGVNGNIYIDGWDVTSAGGTLP
ncbi:MAG: Ig-like domain-containing protein [Syntrophaceae bacterium]